MRILVTGGAGFIGSNFLNLFVARYPEHHFINLDKLTYAANLLNLTEIENLPNYTFVQGDLTDRPLLDQVFDRFQPDRMVHFAAESHVDRSISEPGAFIYTNILGTFHLLEICKKNWQESNGKFREGTLLHHVSTDEVYGSLGAEGLFTEDSRYDPSSPYSASKASGDHLVRSYFRTYGLPVLITNCSNNYGPYQFPEKLIPLMILHALEGKPLPVYGKGENVRDWLYVEDHCEAIWTVMEKGILGETYNIGGNYERKNIELVHTICDLLGAELNRDPQEFKDLIVFTRDRPGHDLRYAIDSSKMMKLGWQPRETFTTGLQKTVQWYLNHRPWVESVQSGAYQNWMKQQYDEKIIK
ncbi:dTDP-glucose 4,6-dehydratase [Dehalobacterium formicoaceticum]|uniref:dTDP-glucose 4,6-dehydratase n=1 Tax=Dehalobacterium formicoaceticum TaxID=51515 RepID=UPI000B7FDBDE|nr:dTDP-glucose 4,6-dehydratase [Dehalobacterium formicoaceticum]